jgi:hypothetical protein
MLALFALQAVLGAACGRSMASPGQSGSTAPALQMVRVQISDMSSNPFHHFKC